MLDYKASRLLRNATQGPRNQNGNFHRLSGNSCEELLTLP